MAEITKKEFLELLQEFSKKNLDPKFQKMDERFENMDTRFEKIDERFEKMDTRFEKIDERFEKMDEQFKKVDSRFTEFREDIVHQFHVISEDVISKVQLVAEGVATLNEKFDRRIDELEKKNEEQHKDILAAVKFSYAELDRRITTLEAEMEDLKRRMDKIERRSVS
jgi:chromosome segregation ATPase